MFAKKHQAVLLSWSGDVGRPKCLRKDLVIFKVFNCAGKPMGLRDQTWFDPVSFGCHFCGPAENLVDNLGSTCRASLPVNFQGVAMHLLAPRACIEPPLGFQLHRKIQEN